VTWNRLLHFARSTPDFVAFRVAIPAFAGLIEVDSLLAAARQVRGRLEYDATDRPAVLYETAKAMTLAGRLDKAKLAHSASLRLFYSRPLRDNPGFQAPVENWHRRE
jgi:hypothetical protein